MWGSKIIGTGMGASVMGTLLVSNGFAFTIIVQTILMLFIILFPLLILERPGEQRFPWNSSILHLKGGKNNIQNPFKTLKYLFHSFSKLPCSCTALFILLSALNQGVNSGILPVYYNTELGWSSDTYSQVVGVPGTILEFIGAMLGGLLADRFGKRKIFFLGWGGFSILSGLFGFIVLVTEKLPDWFQIFYLIGSPFLVAMGTVSMFALAMSLSWSKAAATMFTSYMAIANLSVIVGTKLIEPLTSTFSLGYVYIIMMFVCLFPAFLLKSMNPRDILDMKSKKNEKI